MSINLGNSAISNLKLGSNQVAKVYKGDTLVWPVSTAVPTYIVLVTDYTGVIDLTDAIKDESNAALSSYEWEILGGGINSSGTNSLIDLSGNTGGATVVIESPETAYSIEMHSKLITNIDVRDNTEVTYLSLYNNPIASIDISYNTMLTHLDMAGTSLAVLDISNNTKLVTAYLSSLALSAIDVTSNTDLTFLNLNVNSITSIDISNNTKLTSLYIQSNPLSSTEIDNVYIDLDTAGKLSGELRIDSGRTAASDTARANLIAKGWIITD